MPDRFWWDGVTACRSSGSEENTSLQKQRRKGVGEGLARDRSDAKVRLFFEREKRGSGMMGVST